MVGKVCDGAVGGNGNGGVLAVFGIVENTDSAHAAPKEHQWNFILDKIIAAVNRVEDCIDLIDRIKAHPVPGAAVRPDDQHAAFAQIGIIRFRFSFVSMAVVKALNIHRNGEDVTGKLPVIDPGIGLEGVGVDAEHCFKRVRRDFYPGG